MNRKLFVYGTLRRDAKHELSSLLERHARFVGRGAVRGKLYDLGDYPGLRSEEDGRVLGDVYEINEKSWSFIIHRLDEYEGCSPSDPEPHEYRRDIVPVYLRGGRTLSAWAYVLNRDPKGLTEIVSGDYMSWRLKAGA